MGQDRGQALQGDWPAPGGDHIFILHFFLHFCFQALYLKCLICEVADSEREFVEGNIMGYIMNKAKKPDIYPKDEEANGMTTKTFNIKPPS